MSEKSSFVELQNLFIQRLGLKKDCFKESKWESIFFDFLKKTPYSSFDELFLKITTNEKLFQSLTEELIVPETWFFREKESIFYVADFLKKKRERPVRILSLPCSSGEEPYSIAMALWERGFPSEDFIIDGVDISQCGLKRGEAAIYDERSFRGDERWKEKWFEKIGDGYQLPQFIREKVHFFHVNILDPGAFLPYAPYSVIFCRHLLIYLNENAVAFLFKRLWKLLEPKGILVVGAAEAEMARKFGFVSVKEGKVPVFLRGDLRHNMSSFKGKGLSVGDKS